jgi:hypothetical protein
MENSRARINNYREVAKVSLSMSQRKLSANQATSGDKAHFIDGCAKTHAHARHG